jgi:hypothetical protein
MGVARLPDQTTAPNLTPNARHAAKTPAGSKGLWGLIETRLIQKRLFRRAFFQDRLGAFVANCSS